MSKWKPDTPKRSLLLSTTVSRCPETDTEPGKNNNDLSGLIKEIIKVGYRHVDTAIAYGNEDQVGKGVKEAISEGLVKREDLFITTKIFSKKDKVAEAVDRITRKNYSLTIST